MEVIKFDSELHFEVLKSWWLQYGWVVPELETLPPTGFIAVSNGAPICAGFCYFTDSKMAFMDWIIGDRSADKELRKQGVDMVINALITRAKEKEVGIIYTVTGNTHLINTYKELGFGEMEKNISSLAYSFNKDTDFLK